MGCSIVVSQHYSVMLSYTCIANNRQTHQALRLWIFLMFSLTL